MESTIKIGQVYWVKIKGFPWWPGIISKIFPQTSPNLEPQVNVKFIGDLTYAKISISKIRPFDEYYNEFSKTKKKNLLNIIHLAKKINRGEMSYAQHYKLCKQGISNIKMNNLEESLSSSPNKLGNKRMRNESLNSNYITNELIEMIDDFIYDKRNMQEEEFFDVLIKFRKFLEENNREININGIHSMIKLFRFLVFTRNFNGNIVKKKSFILLKEELKEKIIEKLFDISNIESFIDLKEEKNTLTKGLFDKENENCEGLENQIDNYVLNTEIILESGKINNNFQKKSENNSMSESSINISTGTKTDCDDLKTKISPLDAVSLFNILIFYDWDDNKSQLDMKVKKITKEDLINKIKEIIKSSQSRKYKLSNLSIKDIYLRKRVCCKLFRVFNILFKSIPEIKIEIIKDLCLSFDGKAREIDNMMSSDYKNYISSLFKKIKEFLP